MRNDIMRVTGYGILLSGLKKLDWNNVSHTVRFSTDISAAGFHQYAGGLDRRPPPPYLGPYFTCGFLHANHSDAPDTDSTSFGFAVEDEIGLAANRLRITPGIRFDWYEHRPKSSRSYELNLGFKGYPSSAGGSRLSPKLRAEWNATDQFIFMRSGLRVPGRLRSRSSILIMSLPIVTIERVPRSEAGDKQRL